MPVYAFSGNDELRKHESLDAELARWARLEPETPPIHETHFGEELNAASVAESYQSPDLFAPRKALILRNYDKVNAAGKELLEKAFQTDNAQTAVFITVEKMDGRSAFAKALSKEDRLFEFKLPYDNKIPAWLMDRAKQRYNRKLGPSEAQLLQDIVGNETSELDRELEKLDTFLPKGQALTAESIRDVVSPLKVHTIFEYQKAAGLKKPQDFLPALRNLLDNSGEGGGIGAAMMLFNHFLKLARIRAMMDEGAGEKEIEDTFKLNHFLHVEKERYFEQARKRSLNRWKQLLARLARLEWEMKQGRYSHRFEVEMALAGVALA